MLPKLPCPTGQTCFYSSVKLDRPVFGAVHGGDTGRVLDVSLGEELLDQSQEVLRVLSLYGRPLLRETPVCRRDIT